MFLTCRIPPQIIDGLGIPALDAERLLVGAAAIDPFRSRTGTYPPPPRGARASSLGGTLPSPPRSGRASRRLRPQASSLGETLPSPVTRDRTSLEVRAASQPGILCRAAGCT